MCEKKITENKCKQIVRIFIPATSYNLTLRQFVVTNYLHNHKLGQKCCLLVPWFSSSFSSSFCDQFICSMKQSKRPCMLQCVHMGRFIVRHWENLHETLWSWSSIVFLNLIIFLGISTKCVTPCRWRIHVQYFLFWYMSTKFPSLNPVWCLISV